MHSENFLLDAGVDGGVTCSCCGIFNLEIMCPFSHRDKKYTTSIFAIVARSFLKLSKKNNSYVKYVCKGVLDDLLYKVCMNMCRQLNKLTYTVGPR